MTLLASEFRPRYRLLSAGPKALSDAELVAVLLRTGLPGRSVLSLARDLLEAFGGIAGLLYASADDLVDLNALGCGTRRAELVAVLELARRAVGEQLSAREVFSSPDAVKQFLQLHFAQVPHEVFAVMFLDAQNRLIEMEVIFRGTLTQTSVYPREIVKRALHHESAAVVLAHKSPERHRAAISGRRGSNGDPQASSSACRRSRFGSRDCGPRERVLDGREGINLSSYPTPPSEREG